MIPSKALHEPRELSPPPIPRRNPRRVHHLNTSQGCSPTTDLRFELGIQSSSLTLQNIFEEIDRELEDTRQRLVSTVYASEQSETSLWQQDDVRDSGTDTANQRQSVKEQPSPLWSDSDIVSRTSTSSSLTDGLKRYSAYWDLVSAPSVCRSEERATSQQNIKDAMERFQNIDNPDSIVNTSSYDGESDRTNAAGEDARFEAWLHRGLFVMPPQEADRTSLASKASTHVSEQKYPARSIVTAPPSTPSRREFASPTSPLSPMNNGRDAYGNFIPTNVQDYLTAQSPSTTSELRFISEETDQPKQKPSPALRGGGGWWNNVGIGQTGNELSVKKKPSTVTPESSDRSTPASISKGKSPISIQNSMPSSPKIDGSLRSGAIATTVKSSTKGRPAFVTNVEWSDEESIVEELQQSKLLEKSPGDHPEGDGDGHLEYSTKTTALSTTTGSLSPVFSKYPDCPGGGPRTPLPPHMQAGAEGEPSELRTDLQPVRKLTPGTRDQFEPPLPKTSYSTRTDKRWNKAPSTVPDRAPPPPPENVRFPRAPDSYAQQVPRDRHLPRLDEHGGVRQQPPDSSLFPLRSPSLEAFDYDDGCDLQSLRLGESVSIAGRPERSRQYPVVGAPAQQFATELYREQQMRAQAVFRTSCERVMKQVNDEMIRLRRELQLGRMTQAQFGKHKDMLFGNMDHALQHCAKQDGYIILQTENAIVEAMKTVNGYEIYKEMFHIARSTIWQNLVDQHHRATTPSLPPEEPHKSTSSSFERARHATGKLARFLLAAPSNPELKSYSNRKPPDLNQSAFAAAAMPWLNPMAMSALASNDKYMPKNKDDKGKGREISPIATEGVDEQESSIFAPSRIPVFTATDSNGHWTGTTALPLSIAVQAAERDMRNYGLPQDNTFPRPASLVTEESMWPEGDSQGNWHDVRTRRNLRGGGKRWGW